MGLKHFLLASAIALLPVSQALAQNTAPLVGDASSARVTASGSSTARTLAARAADKLNLLDYYAAGDTDYTAAFNRALTQVTTLGKPVVLTIPCGLYDISGTIAATFSAAQGLIIEGESAACVTINQNADADAFAFTLTNLNGFFTNNAIRVSGIRLGMRVTSSTRTALSFSTTGVTGQAPVPLYIDDVAIVDRTATQGWGTGINVSQWPGYVNIDRIYDYFQTSTGVHINVSGNSTSYTTGVVLHDTYLVNGNVGVNLGNYLQGINIDNLSVIGTNALQVTPNAGVNVQIFVYNSYLDGKVTLAPSGSANLGSVYFANDYFDSLNGVANNDTQVSINNVGGLSILGSTFSGKGSLTGITALSVSGTVVVPAQISNNQFSGYNGSGDVCLALNVTTYPLTYSNNQFRLCTTDVSDANLGLHNLSMGNTFENATVLYGGGNQDGLSMTASSGLINFLATGPDSNVGWLMRPKGLPSLDFIFQDGTGRNILRIWDNQTGVSSSAISIHQGTSTVSPQINGDTTNLLIGATSPLATNATSGFPQIPTMAGTPTGTPTTTGGASLVLNTANSTLCAYNPVGASWGCGTGDVSGASITASGSTTARSPANRALDIGFNVMDSGAVCDGVTDDAAAINVAAAKIRALSGQSTATLLFPPTRKCVIKSTINLVGVALQGVTIRGAGATLVCQTNGTPCVDMLNSRFVNVEDLSIYGSATNSPNIGIQSGIGVYPGQGDSNLFHRVSVTGTFTGASGQLGAAMLNVIGEVTNYEDCIFWNQSTSPTAYTAVWDGFNHWNVQSAFETVNVGVDTSAYSYNDNVCSHCDFRNSGGGNGIWLGGTHGLRITNSSYIGDTGGTGPNYNVVLYGEGTRNNDMLTLQAHMESTSVTNAVLISGTNANPLIYGFSASDYSTNFTGSFFKLDTGISTASFYNADVHLEAYQSGATLFDTPASYTFSGRYASGSITGWNKPGQFSGTMQIGAIASLAYYGNVNMTAQAVDSTATGGNPRGNGAVDLQQTRSAANMVASGANSVIAGGSGNAAVGQYSSVTGGYANSASGPSSTVAGGQGNTMTGYGGVALGGANAVDRSRWALVCQESGPFATPGDAQTCYTTLRGTGASTTAFRLTGDGGAANSANCINIPNNSVYLLRVDVVANNHSTNAASEAWPAWNGYMVRGANAASTALTMATTPTPITTGTVTGSAISATADTTNGCFNLSFTPPTGNANTWNVVARVQTVEVQ